MLLGKLIIIFKKKYPNIYITSNLVYRENLENNKDQYRIPNLHILPNGTVLPWYGFPRKYALWKYPQTTINTLPKKAIDNKIKRFKDLLINASGIALKKKTRVILFDNLIEGVLKS